MLTNLGHVTEHLQKEYDTKHDLNLYRKAFGNIKDVCKQEGVKRVFVLNGTAFSFLHPTKVAEANAQGVLTEAAWAAYQEGQKSYWTKHLNLCKNNKMNICRYCEMKFFITANEDGVCTKPAVESGPHVAKFDFDLNEDVLQCEIPLNAMD